MLFTSLKRDINSPLNILSTLSHRFWCELFSFSLLLTWLFFLLIFCLLQSLSRNSFLNIKRVKLFYLLLLILCLLDYNQRIYLYELYFLATFSKIYFEIKYLIIILFESHKFIHVYMSIYSTFLIISLNLPISLFLFSIKSVTF